VTTFVKVMPRIRWRLFSRTRQTYRSMSVQLCCSLYREVFGIV